jgi:hypothetical protein
MNIDRKAQESSASTQEDQLVRREWTKPQAKAADVAEVTLTGFATPPQTDFSTCAS